MKYRISWEEQGVVVVFKGSLTMGDLIDYQKELQGNEKYDELGYVIADYRKADIAQIGKEDRELSLGMSIGASYSLPSLKLAIVGTDLDTINFAKYRVEKFKKYGVNWEMRIFATTTEARKWIDTTSRWR